MADWRDQLQKQSIKYVVVGVAAANCVGIYLANERLNRPHTAPVTETFVAAADYTDVASVRPSPAAESAPSLVSSAPALALDTSAEATALTRSEVLPALAPLPPLRLEAAPVIPSVPARAARLGMNENRVARTAHRRSIAASTRPSRPTTPRWRHTMAPPKPPRLARRCRTRPQPVPMKCAAKRFRWT